MCDYKAAGLNVTQNFLRHFEEEGRRPFYRNEKPTKLGCIFYKDETGEKDYEVNISKRPEFKITSGNIDFENLVIDVQMSLGTVFLEGKYTEVTEPTSPTCGNFTLNLHEVIAKGKIPFFTNEDSFYPENSDLQYSCSNLYTMELARDSGLKESRELNFDSFEIEQIWSLLNSKLNEFFFRQLMAVIVEYSVMESLYDEDEPYKTYCKQKASSNNKVIEEILQKVNNSLGGDIPTKDLTKLVKTTNNCLENLIGTKGTLKGVNTIERANNFNTITTAEGFKVIGKIKFQNIEHFFDDCSYNGKDGVVKGKITTAFAYSTKIDVCLTFRRTTEGYQASVSKQKRAYLGDLDIDISDEFVNLNDCITDVMEAYIHQEVLPLIINEIFGKIEAVLRINTKYATDFLNENLKLC